MVFSHDYIRITHYQYRACYIFYLDNVSSVLLHLLTEWKNSFIFWSSSAKVFRFLLLKISPTLHKHFKGYCSAPNIIMLFIYMKFRFTLSYRDLEEMTVMRGAFIDHSTLQRRVKGFAKLIEQRVRKRKRPVNGSWWMDETYIKLNTK